MAAREQTISVSLKLNTSGFQEGLVLTDRQAKTMGKNIAQALTIDPKSATSAFKTIGIEKDKLMANFLKLKGVIKDSLSITSAQSKASADKLKELGVGLKTVNDNARKASESLKSIKFVIGQTNKNIDSVIKKLERLETTANKIKTINVGVNYVQQGGAPSSGRGGGGGARQASSRTPYGPQPLIPITKSSEERAPISTRERAEGRRQLEAVNKRLEQNANTPVTPKSGAGTKFVAFAEFEKQGAAAGDRTAKAFDKGFKKVNTLMEAQAERSKNAFTRTFSANFLADALVSSLSGVFNILEKVSIKTAIYAARTEELGVVLTTLARVNNVSTATIVEQEVAVKRLNITTQDARETLARFLNVGFDVKQAGPLARVAQDLAVIGNLSTSEELDKLVVGIQTLQSRNLRTAGVFITVDEVLDKLSQTTGRARDSFSTLEKQQAVLSAVLEYGAKVAGTYESAMETVSKQLRSMERLFFEAQNAVGTGLIPALEAFVVIGSKVLQWVTIMPNTLLNLVQTIGLLTASFLILKTTMLQTFAVGVGSFLSAATAGLKSGFSTPALPIQERKQNLIKVRELRQEQQELTKIYIARTRIHSAAQQELATASTLLKNDLTRANLNTKIAAKKRVELTSSRVSNTVDKLNANNDLIRRGGVPKQPLSERFASAVGNIAIVGGIASALYTAAAGIDEYSNSLFLLNSIDLSAAQRTADDLVRIATQTKELENASTVESSKAKDIIQNLTALSRGRLNIDLAQLDTTKHITDELRKQLITQLQLEKTVLLEKQKDQRTKAIVQIEKSSFNVGKEGANVDALQEAERVLVERLGSNKQNFADIGFFDKLVYNAELGFSKLGKIINLGTQSTGESWEIFANRMTNDSGEMTLALADVREELSKAQVLSEAELEKRKQAISDYLKVSELIGERNPLEYLKKEANLTTSELAQAAIELKGLEELAKKEIQVKIDLTFADPTTTTFNSFAEAFKKQREAQQKKTQAVIDSDPRLNTPELRAARLKEFTLDTDVNYLGSQPGQEGLQTLQSAIAQELQKNKGEKNAGQVLNQELERLGNTDDNGKALVDALKVLKERGQYTQEAQDEIEKLTKISALSQARSTGRSLLNESLSEKKDLFITKESNQQLEAFIQQSTELGKTAEQIEHVRFIYKLLFSIDPAKAIEGLRSLNAVSKEAANLKAAQESDRDARNPEIQRLKTTTEIQSLETSIYLLKLKKNPRIQQLENEQKLTTDIRNAEEKLTELKTGKNAQLESLERQIKIEEAVLSFKEQQKSIEDEISILKVTSVLPAINAQLLAEKAILTTIQERKQTEQQLTADIALEIDKRTRYNLNSTREVNRVVAETFLERTRETREGQEGLLKALVSSEYTRGNTELFANNPQIKEAVRQSQELEKIKEEGGVQTLILSRTNEILEQGVVAKADIANTLSDSGNKKLDSIGNVLAEGFTGLLQASSFSQDTGDSMGLVANEAAKYALNYFQTRGWTREQSAGLVGNLQVESGNFSAGVISGKVKGDGGKAVGAGQWHPDRQAKFQRVFGRSIIGSSLEQQLAFVDWELKNSEIFAGQRLRGAKTAGSAAAIVDKYYERSAGLHTGKRIASANSLLGLSTVASPIGTSATGTSATGIAKVITYNKGQDAELKVLNDAAKAGDSPALKKLQDYQEKVKKEEVRTAKFMFDRLSSITGTNKALDKYTLIETQAAIEILGILDNQDHLKKRQIQAYKNHNAAEIKRIEAENILWDYAIELANELKFGSNTRAAQGNVLKRQSKDLQVGGPGYTKTIEEAVNERIAKRNQESTEYFKLQEEIYHRTADFNTYLADQEKSFDAGKDRTTAELQDRLTAIQLEQNYREELEYTEDLRAEIYVDRKQALQDLQKETKKLALIEESGYFASQEFRDTLQKEFDNSNLQKRAELLKEIGKLQTENNNVETIRQQGLLEIEQLRLETADSEVNRMRDRIALVKEELQQQVRVRELNEEGINAGKFRQSTLENARSKMKSQTELMAELFNGTFDAINDSFGSLIDKMTKKMGFFGGVLGNLLKGITGNLVGRLQTSIIDGIFGPDPLLTEKAAKQEEQNAIGAPDFNDLFSGIDPVLQETIIHFQALNDELDYLVTSDYMKAQEHGRVLDAYASGEDYQNNIPMSELESALLTSGNTVIAANNGTAQSVVALGQTVGSVSVGLMSIVGIVQERVNAIASISPPGGGAGGAGGGGGSNAAAIINAVSTGQQQISGVSTNLPSNTSASTPSISAPSTASVLGTVASGIVSAAPRAGGAKGILQRQGGGILSKIAGGASLKSIGGGLISSLPFLGAGLGGALGGGSGIGGLLGQAGGLLGGVAGLGALGALGVGGATGIFGGAAGIGGIFGAGGILGGVGGALTGLGGLFGATGVAATALGATVVLAPIAAALLVGAYFFGRNAKRKKNEKIRNTAMLEALPALQELLKGVKTDKLDGDEALTRAGDIRKQYLEQMGKLDDKKTRRIALKDVSRLDAIISEIKVAAKSQTIRREIDERIVPTYAQGGTGHGLIRVSRGESLFVPHTEGTFSGSHITAANIPNFADGGSYTGVKIRGNFDGQDNILTHVPKGTVIANPRQVSKIRQSRGFATGGVVGRSGSPTAQGAITVQPPPVSVIVVFTQEEAEALGRQIPNSVIAGKVRQHVRETGTTGLVGDIYNTFR